VLGGDGTILGGVGAGEANVIAYNGDAGVEVQGLSSTSNTIRGNSIFSNGGIGIDLGGDGVTANDANDADSGPNERQNYPIVASATPNAPSGTNVQGVLDSAPSTTYTLDFYASPGARRGPRTSRRG
jgi:parallel beta-helix repeat protein